MKLPKRTEYLVNYLFNQFKELKNPSPPFLLKGCEGSGRSWILSLLAEKLSKEQNLLVIKIPFLLNGQGLVEFINEEINRIKSSRIKLEQISEVRKKKIVLILEGLDRLFSLHGRDPYKEMPRKAKGRGATQIQQIFHASELRSFLLENRSKVSLVGSSDLEAKFMNDPELPFFNFFNVIEIKPLSPDESRNYLSSQLGNSMEIKKIVEELEYLSLDAIHQLTEGLISYLNLFRDASLKVFISKTKKIDYKMLQDILESYFISITPYMMNKVNQLSYSEGALIDRMAFLPPQFRGRDIKFDDQKISKYLIYLKKKGFIIFSPQDSSYYKMTSSIFRSWLRFRKGMEIGEIFN